jgi:hypothetical protein
MTFEDGCRTALHDTSDSSIHALSMIKCLPMKMHVLKYNKTKKNTSAHLLIHQEELNDITNESSSPEESDQSHWKSNSICLLNQQSN